MKCEICHKHDAEVPLTCKIDGVEKELYVCKACAERRRRAPAEPEAPSDADEPAVKVVQGGEDAPAFVKDLLKATLGFVAGVAKAERDAHRVCPACKTSWEKIHESGRIPCPHCYRAFAKEIHAEFLRSQFARRHVGERPANSAEPTGAACREELEHALKDAIAREDYRKAAQIQKQLKALGDAGGEKS